MELITDWEQQLTYDKRLFQIEQSLIISQLLSVTNHSYLGAHYILPPCSLACKSLRIFFSN